MFFLSRFVNFGANFFLFTLRSVFLNSYQIFTANSDQDTIVYNVLSSSIRARYIRIQPWTYHNHISMRMEIYGC